MGELLIDSMPLMSFSLEEAAPGKGDKIVMRGQFARSDKATENKRLYRETLWRREFGRLSEGMSHRRMFGELDHPSDGRTKLSRVSHLVTSLTIKGNEVIGEAEVLDTPNGRILKTLAKAKAQVGVSSRGYGSTKTLPNGDQEVQEDFRLDTFDFVADPATKTAYPQVFAEEREHIQEAEVEMTLDTLKRDYPGLVEELVGQVSSGGAITAASLTEAEERAEKRALDRTGINLRRAIELAEGDIRSEVRSELMSDPKVAGALGVVEQIVGLVKSYGIDPQAHDELMVKDDDLAKIKSKVEDQALELHKLQQEGERDKKLIRQLAYTLHVEQLLGKDPSRKAIEALLGDVTQYESKEEITVKVSTFRDELERRGGPAPAAEDAKAAEDLKKAQEDLDLAKAKVSELEAKVEDAQNGQSAAEADAEKAKETADKALGVAEGFEARLYAEQKLNEGALGAEDRTKLRGLCESAISIEKVDEIFEGFVSQRTPDGDEASRIRERVGRGKSHDQKLEEEGASPSANGNGKMTPDMLEEVGVGGGKGEFDRLAGTGSGGA